MLSRHRLMVVPSRWPEPFGIVALEGMASGCVVIGTDLGGLPEAIGPGGVIVPAANPKAIADAVRVLLADDELCVRYRRAGAGFAARHAPRDVARDYIEVLGRAARRQRRGGDAQATGIRRLPADGEHSSTRSG
jgi:glycosyltransferase involved in cell wall biosynthesis